MKVVNAGIARGTAQPGVEVSFRGEGSDMVSIHLRDDSVTEMTDSEIYLRAREVMTEVVGSKESHSSHRYDLPERHEDGPSGAKSARLTHIGEPVPLGIIRPDDFRDLGLESPRTQQAADDIEALRAQVAELSASVARLGRSAVRAAEAHPLTAAAVALTGIWALAGLTARNYRRRWI